MNIPFCMYIHQKFFEYICKSYALIREIFPFIFMKFTLLKFAIKCIRTYNFSKCLRIGYLHKRINFFFTFKKLRI